MAGSRSNFYFELFLNKWNNFPKVCRYRDSRFAQCIKKTLRSKIFLQLKPKYIWQKNIYLGKKQRYGPLDLHAKPIMKYLLSIAFAVSRIMRDGCQLTVPWFSNIAASAFWVRKGKIAKRNLGENNAFTHTLTFIDYQQIDIALFSPGAARNNNIRKHISIFCLKLHI